MATKSFSISLRDDGTARLSFIYRTPRQTGISRLSCDLAAAGLARLAAFCEICDLQPARTLPLGLDLDALALRWVPGTPGMLHILRMGRQSAGTVAAPFHDLHAELEEATDRCLAMARTSRRGRIIWELLGGCGRPEALPAHLPPDEADHILHRLSEITLLSLAGDAANPKSGLSRKLRRTRSSDEAAEHVGAALSAQARLLFPSGGLPHAGAPAPDGALARGLA
ncbi:hypothetical protein [Mangrovicoccus sp. HB161399]|uniref:hypothetical protein n=1 Tax=Mangrovicoccus sp. HB161399 TaxID=2720392 RepID=UPI00155800A2|nr:hypothetical protein [Mangrovicoccus sp. HB161399]